MDAQKFNRLLDKIKYDKNAVLSIYKEYYLQVKSHVNSRFKGSVNPEDIAQDVFLKLMALKNHSYVQYPTSWLYKMADNCAYDALGKQPRDAELVEALIGEFDLDYTIAEEDMKSALRNVDEQSQEILYMRFWEGYSYKEIAEILNMTHGNVRAKACRACKILKKFL